MPIELRAVTAADAEAVAAHMNRCLQEEGTLLELNQAPTAEYIKQFVEFTGKKVLLICLDEAQVIGYLQLVAHATAPNTGYGHVSLEPEFRHFTRAGTAKRLIDEMADMAMEMAAAEGMLAVYACIRPSNTPAIKVVQRHGFTNFGFCNKGWHEHTGPYMSFIRAVPNNFTFAQ
ncbi:MAG: GNAT family N-acetyltransferase [Candidatus Obscuribacterales bacterium]|nr:GNAT family N-acetyltransferase [Candidatus Obscuribacterales bacterium]